MIRSILILTTLILLAACSSPEASPPTEAVKAPVAQVPAAAPSKRAIAKLVRNEEAKLWPHLQRHMGQLLLMNRDTQILIPTAPPLTLPQSYFPLISKVYRLNGKEWTSLPYLPATEISLSNEAGEALQLIGQDISEDQGTESVVTFFRLSKSGSHDAKISMTLQMDQARLDIKIQSQDPKLKYSLRQSKGLSEDHPIPITAKTVAGLTSALLPEAVSIIGYRPFVYAQSDSAHILSSGEKNPGFSVLLARDALIHQTNLLHSLTPCYGADTSAQACLAPLSAPDSPPKQTWKLEAPRLKKGEQPIWQSAMIYSKTGSFRAMIPIREGETLDVPLGSADKTKWELLVSDGEGVMRKTLLPTKKRSAIKIPKVAKGTLFIKSDSSSPRYIEIRSAVQRNGQSLLAWVQEAKTFLVSPNTLLQSQWPMTLALPAGDYSVKIYDGFRMQCEQQLTILKNRKNTIECNEPAFVPAFSTRASISVDRAAIPEGLLKASGITVITSSEKTSPAGLTSIPVLAAYDSELGLSIRAFPSDPDLERSWNGLIRNNPERSTLQFFADYIRSHKKGASIVLDCPPPGFQLAEYRWIAQSIKPDVLEVFGCQEPSSAKELLETAARLQQQKDVPVRLAAASFTESRYGPRVPAIYLPRYKHFAITHKTSEIDPKLVLADLQNGDYTLGFRTELNVPRVKRTQKKVPIRLKTAGPTPRKVIVRIHDQDDRLSEIEMVQDARQSTLDVPLSLKTSSKFIRIEVLGRDLAEDPLFTLATSNFFRLDEDAPANP